MTPPRWLAAELAEAKKVGPYTGSDLPEYKPGQHCPVTLPSRGPEGGWKVSTEEEWDKVFYYNREKDECGVSSKHWRALADLHMRAYYASGQMLRDCNNVKDTIAMFRRNGLACTPWKQGRHFWGLKNSVKKARARLMKAGQDLAQQRHDNWIEHLIELMGEVPDADLSHHNSYYLETCKAALREAAGRGVELPDNVHELRKLLGKMLGPSGVCPDCLLEKLLVILEHAKGGPDAGRARLRDCIVCNQKGRSFTDMLIAVAHALEKTLTAEDHTDVADLAVAYARPGQATPEAKRRYARALRLAAAATVEEDERALAYESTTRGGGDDDGPTLQQKRAAFEKKEAARLAKRREWLRAHRAQPRVSFRATMRVVVKETGARGVVERTAGSGIHIYVKLDGVPGAKHFRPKHLDIDKSPRKPAARKPAAKKKPSKKKARK